MSYGGGHGGQSNPPWRRNLGVSGMGNQMPGMYNANMNNMNQQTPQMNYSQPRGLNQMAFGSNVGPMPLMGVTTQRSVPQQKKSFIGFITKLHSDCGFVDDDVFFSLKVCKGMPKLGDRVLVEASHTPHSNYAWNATRIQIIPGPNIITEAVVAQQKSALVAIDQQKRRPTEHIHSSSTVRQDPKPRETEKDHLDEIERRRRRERERHERESSRNRERSPRRPSPKRRRARIQPVYSAKIPTVNLNLTKGNIFDISKRYQSLYIPSDFFFTDIKWPESFPPNNPFSIQHPCTFTVMHKDVDNLSNDEIVLPEDLDYKFSAKVMLMACPPIAEFYNKCFMQDDKDERDCVHPSRLIKFLVGVRGRNEPMAIGGPWSPSLDGENPESDPTVLIKTAIRNCMQLTGIDLSRCTKWYRFVELYYHRAESVYKGNTIPARVETVVIFLPDVNSCMPTPSEWKNLQKIYTSKMENLLSKFGKSKADDGGGSVADSGATKSSSSNNKQDKESSAAGDTDQEQSKGTHYSKLDPKVMKMQLLRDELEARNIDSKGLKPQLIARLTKALRTEKAEEEKNKDSVDPENENENEESNQGGDAQENENESKETRSENDTPQGDMDLSDMVVLDEYDAKQQENQDREQAMIKRNYKLPETAHIIVHPSKTAKSGKFDCSVMSLSVLLDYRQADNKERSFEVSLFAELFNEMIMRDCGFEIYKELKILAVQNIAKEKEKEKEKLLEKEREKEKEKAEESNKTEENDKEENKNGEVESVEEKEVEKNEEKDKGKNQNRESDKKDDNVSEKSSRREHRKSRDRSHDRRSERKSRDRSHDRTRKRKRTRSESEEDDKHKVKTYIAKKNLLLSFIYFETTQCGYMFERDIQDLLYIIGLNLSRNQIREFLSKAIKHDPLQYRKLTHKPKEDENKKSVEQTVPEFENTVEIAPGNASVLPIFFDTTEQINVKQNGDPKIVKSNMITYNGALIDVAKLVEQHKRTEKARDEIEEALSNLQVQNSELQKNYTKGEQKIKSLQTEVKSLSRKLDDTKDNLSSINRKYHDQQVVLQNIYDKVTPFCGKSSREKERDRKDRDKKDERSISRARNMDNEDSNDNDKKDIDSGKSEIKEEEKEQNKTEEKIKEGSEKDKQE